MCIIILIVFQTLNSFSFLSGAACDPIDGVCVPDNGVGANQGSEAEGGVEQEPDASDQQEPVSDSDSGDSNDSDSGDSNDSDSGDSNDSDSGDSNDSDSGDSNDSDSGDDVQLGSPNNDAQPDESVKKSSSDKEDLCEQETLVSKQNTGTLTLKLLGKTEILSEYNAIRIWPNPYTSIKNLVVLDDSQYDCDARDKVMTLDHVPFNQYQIQVINFKMGKSLLKFNFSITQDNLQPIINVVKRDLAIPLSPQVIPDQYLLVLEKGLTNIPQIANDVSSRYDVKIFQIYEGETNAILIGVSDNSILDELMKDSRIAYKEQDMIGRLSSIEGQITPPGVNRIGGDLYASRTLNRINLTSSTNQIGANTDMIDVDVAILDSGISLEHPDLNVYRNVSFVNYTGLGNDDNGHGTHVAGTVAALDNSFGVVGVAPGARLWSVKVCDGQGSCSLSDQIKGVQYVIDHADEIDVVNMSIENIFSPTLNAVIQEAVKRGITFVVPAGNSFRDASNTSPANSPYVISVSAMIDTDGFCGGYGIESFEGQDDEFAWFSNFGKDIDMSAPGVDILSTYYGTEYAIDSGTSMAAPHVTGIAALLKSKYPDMTPLQTYKTLINASIGPGALCDKDLGGYFSGDVDSIQERMVQIPGLITKNN